MEKELGAEEVGESWQEVGPRQLEQEGSTVYAKWAGWDPVTILSDSPLTAAFPGP